MLCPKLGKWVIFGPKIQGIYVVHETWLELNGVACSEFCLFHLFAFSLKMTQWQKVGLLTNKALQQKYSKGTNYNQPWKILNLKSKDTEG